MDGEGYGEMSMTRGKFLKRLLVIGILSSGTYHVAKGEYTPSADEVYARDMLKDEDAWEERDGIFVAGEGEVANTDGSEVDYRVATEAISEFLVALARREGIEEEFRTYLARNPLHIFLDRPQSVTEHDWTALEVEDTALGFFLPAEGKSMVVISKLFFDLYNQTDRKSDLIDMVFAHELHHLFQYVKGEARSMIRNTMLLDAAANGSGYALAHELVGGVGAKNPVTTRRALFKFGVGFAGMSLMGSISRRFLGGPNSLIERDAYSETEELTQNEFFIPFKGKFLQVTDLQ